MSILSLGERVVRSAWRVTPQRALSEVIGWSAGLRLPSGPRAALLRSFARRFGIDLDEAEKPVEEYSGLQELFTRRLRPGARPIDPRADAVVSPSDGTLVDVGSIRDGQIIQAKGGSYSVAGLLADPEAARRLEGGDFAIVYLSPRDYHRVHTPIAGSVIAWRYVPGALFPVNDRSVAREPGLFGKNERFVTLLDSDAGPAAVVMVAAVGVGHITASYDGEVATHSDAFSTGEPRARFFPSPIPLGRGDEVGVFNLGSTAIVLFARGRVRFNALAPGTPVRMGQAIGTVAPAPPSGPGGAP
jgi:phosphatidylserine decarboxylase